MAYIAFRTSVGDHLSRDTHHHRVIRYILRDHAVRADGGIVADFYGSDNFRPRPVIDIVANDWIALILASIGIAQCHPLREVAVLSYRAVRIHKNAAKVADVKATADLSLNWDMDAKFVGLVTQQEKGNGVNRIFEPGLLS